MRVRNACSSASSGVVAAVVSGRAATAIAAAATTSATAIGARSFLSILLCLPFSRSRGFPPGFLAAGAILGRGPDFPFHNERHSHADAGYGKAARYGTGSVKSVRGLSSRAWEV